MVGKPMNNTHAAMFRDMVAMVREKVGTDAFADRHGGRTNAEPGTSHAVLYDACAEVSTSQTGDEAFAHVLYLYVTNVDVMDHEVWTNEILPTYEQS